MREVTFSDIQKFKEIVNEEILLHGKYLSVLELERNLAVSLEADRLKEVSEERDSIATQMKELASSRVALIREIAGSDLKATEFFKTLRPNKSLALKIGPEREELMALALKLKEAATLTKSRTQEFGQVIGFSTKLLNGIISIFWSATQSVTKSYSKSGIIKEQYHPTVSRKEGVIKEA